MIKKISESTEKEFFSVNQIKLENFLPQTMNILKCKSTPR